MPSPLSSLGVARGGSAPRGTGRMLRTGSGGSGGDAPASPGFARTFSSTELGVGTVPEAKRGLGRYDRTEASRGLRWRLVACALGCVVSLVVLVLLGTLGDARNDVRHVVVFDGGSSSTRVHVFQLDVPPAGLPTVKAHLGVRRAVPGLSHFADDPGKVTEYLKPLLMFAETLVPRNTRKQTPVLVMATAGLRAVQAEDDERMRMNVDAKNELQESRAELVLEHCRSAVRHSAFQFRDEYVELIDGKTEGLYAWISVNYAFGTIHEKPENTMGVLELGGASMQITFRPEKKPPEMYRTELLATGRKWSVYTHSALGLGLDAARSSYLKGIYDNGSDTSKNENEKSEIFDACALRGTPDDQLSSDLLVGNKVTPRGNFNACRLEAGKLLGAGQTTCDDFGEDATKYEKHANNKCGVGGSFLPPLRGSFLATENFAHTVVFLWNAGYLEVEPGEASIEDVARAGELLCASKWEDAVRGERTIRMNGKRGVGKQSESFTPTPSDLANACFGVSYVVATLRDALSVDESKQNVVRFSNQVDGITVDWAMGAGIAHVAAARDGTATQTNYAYGPVVFYGWSVSVTRMTGLDAYKTRILLGIGVPFVCVVGGFLRQHSSRLKKTASGSGVFDQTQLRLGELKVRLTLGVPSKGGVTSPTKGRGWKGN